MESLNGMALALQGGSSWWSSAGLLAVVLVICCLSMMFMMGRGMRGKSKNDSEKDKNESGQSGTKNT